MKFLYLATHGSEDPTRATLPFLMAKGAAEAGHTVEIVLMGDSVVLFNDTVADSVQGVGVAPLKPLRQFLRDQNIPVFG
jgi:predicted peroxiredoxin